MSSSSPIQRWWAGHARARNETAAAPWSFRARLEALAGDPARAADLAARWLDSFRSVTQVAIAAGDPTSPRVAAAPRPAVDAVLICPWLRRTPGNACSASCGSCASRRLDLARAPFQLIAIVNRADLASAGPCGRDGGELRFVYTAVDPSSGRALPFTVIFEYGVTLPAGQTQRGWAAAWRALGGSSSESHADRLHALVERALDGAVLRRVGTNEVAFGEAQGLPWEMRQFAAVPAEGGGFVLAPVAVAQTPHLALDGSPELAAFAAQNARAVLAGDNLLRGDYQAATALVPSAGFAWRLPGAAAAVSAAFNQSTCNGCHGGRSEGELAFQHIAPPLGATYHGSGAPARALVSRFLHDPGRADELGRRAAALQEAACAVCPRNDGGVDSGVRRDAGGLADVAAPSDAGAPADVGAPFYTSPSADGGAPPDAGSDGGAGDARGGESGARDASPWR